MSLSLRQMQVFTAVAETGSTMAAADQIALSQSAVSSALSDMERLLGVTLFDRIGKRLHLNEEGRSLLIDARSLLEMARDIEARHGLQLRTSGQRSAPQLRISASTTVANYLLPDLVAAFARGEPGTEMDMAIGNSREVALAVVQLQADLGLIEGPCHEPELNVTPWIQDELVIACSPNHSLARLAGARVSLEQLRDASWLLREPGSGTREAVEQALLPKLHQLNTQIRLGGTEAIKRATRAGLGITCLSRFALQDMLSNGELIQLNTPLKGLRRSFYFVRHKKRVLSEGMNRFVEFCEDHAPSFQASKH